MDLRPLTDSFAVAPQIAPDTLPTIAEKGYASVLCNRPDGEEFGQPDFNEIAQAAEAAGLQSRTVPIISGQVTQEALDQFRAALDEMPKPILAYCRSGTRCTMLWALTQIGTMESSEIERRASEAGYDVSGLLRQMGA
jgi:uncharacterized protein (TIGR01244 family)